MERLILIAAIVALLIIGWNHPLREEYERLKSAMDAATPTPAPTPTPKPVTTTLRTSTLESSALGSRHK